MPVFAIVAPSANTALDAVIKERFHEYFMIAPGQYLVADDKGTTVEVSDHLGASDNKVGQVLVMPVQNFAGWHRKDMWEWIAAKSGGGATPATRAKDG